MLVPYADDQLVNNQFFVKEMFLNILQKNDEKFRLIVKRDAAGFSEKYKMKLFPILKMKFDGTQGPAMDDYMIDYILSGSIALIVRHFQKPDEKPTEVLAATIIEFFNRVYQADS